MKCSIAAIETNEWKTSWYPKNLGESLGILRPYPIAPIMYKKLPIIISTVLAVEKTLNISDIYGNAIRPIPI